jgi:ABC-2 type transport system permease protein
MRDLARVAHRVLLQLWRDPRYLAMSSVVPVLLVILLDALFEDVPVFHMLNIPIGAYALPAAAFFIFFLTYIVCTIVLIRERREGTLSRMFAAGYSRGSVVLGYVTGYGLLAVAQTLVVIVATAWVFDLSLSGRVVPVVLTTLLMALVSLALGVFISTLARSEGQIFPTIPLVIIPSLLLSGLVIPLGDLHVSLRAIAYVLPLTYAEKVLLGVMRDGESFAEVAGWFLALVGYGAGLLIVASLTVRESE